MLIDALHFAITMCEIEKRILTTLINLIDDDLKIVVELSLPTLTLQIFKRYQVNIKDIKCFFSWWEKHKSIFHIVGFLAHQILGILGSKIKTI